MKKVKANGPRGSEEIVTVKPWYPTSVQRIVIKGYNERTETDIEDATIQSLGNTMMMGEGYMLRVPLDIDPETEGEWWDCDGDRAMDRIFMFATKVPYVHTTSVKVTGFVADNDELDYGPYHFEEWWMHKR